jgi:intracellular septation protein A
MKADLLIKAILSMNSFSLLLGILPLFVFVILDSFLGPKKAMISAIVCALGEFVFSLVYFKEVDTVSLVSLALLAVLSYLSFKTDNPRYFKYQPVILSWLFALVLFASTLLGKPILLAMMDKYQSFMPDQTRHLLREHFFRSLITKFNYCLGFSLIAHGALTAFAAHRLSNWWWLIIRGIGFYFFLFLAMVAARL